MDGEENESDEMNEGEAEDEDENEGIIDHNDVNIIDDGEFNQMIQDEDEYDEEMEQRNLNRQTDNMADFNKDSQDNRQRQQ